LLVPTSAQAAIDNVMGGTVACAVQASGQRLCGTGAATVAITFRQAIAASEPLRTGTYAATVTFSLSTTTP
jgi:hypothetical protein